MLRRAPLGLVAVGLAVTLVGCGLERERARRALKDESPAVRAEGARRLGELRAAEAVDALVGLLADPSPRVRRAAVAALGAIGERRVLPAVGARLRDQDTEVRLAAVRILGDLGPRVRPEQACAHGRCPEPVEALLDALDDQAQVVRRAAGFALADVGFERRAQVRALAMRRRLQLSTRLQHPNPSIRRRAAEDLGRMEDPAAVDALRRALGDSDLEVAREAARALGRIGGAGAAALLAAAGADATRDAAAVGLVALAAAGDVRAEGRLGDLLGHPDAAVRRGAALAAARLGARRAPLVVALTKVLADPDPEVAVAAAAALAGVEVAPAALQRAGDPRTTARLLAALGPSVPAATRRPVVASLVAAVGEAQVPLDAAGAAALASLRDPDVDRALLARATADFATWSRDATPWLDEAAWRTLDEATSQPASAPTPQGKLAALLARYPERTTRPEAGTLLPPTRSAAEVAAVVAVVGRIAEARPLCRTIVASSDPELRAAALVALAQSPPASARTELRAVVVKALTDPSPAVRRAAAAALASLGQVAVPDLAPLLADPDFEIRAIAARALGAQRSVMAVEALVKALRDDAHYAVVEALGRQGDRRAVKPLLERLREDTPVGHESERAALVEALGALAAPEAAVALAAELWHPDTEVRLAAARALGALPAAARGAAGREALAARSEDPDGEVRRACRRAVEGAPASVPAAPAR